MKKIQVGEPSGRGVTIADVPEMKVSPRARQELEQMERRRIASLAYAAANPHKFLVD